MEHERDRISQREYEDRQMQLEQDIERALRALWTAESDGSSMRVRMNREDALRQAQEAYDAFMGKE